MIIVEGDAPWNLSSATSAQTELNEMELKTCANETDLFSSSNDLYTTSSQGMFQSASQGFILKWNFKSKVGKTFILKGTANGRGNKSTLIYLQVVEREIYSLFSDFYSA